MSHPLAVWFLVFLGLLAANFPFFSQRRLWRPSRFDKSLAVRFVELVLLYVLVGGVGLLLEKQAGQIAPQTWEFYAITGTLFLTFAFPGFVYRYLLNRQV